MRARWARRHMPLRSERASRRATPHLSADHSLCISAEAASDISKTERGGRLKKNVVQKSEMLDGGFSDFACWRNGPFQSGPNLGKRKLWVHREKHVLDETRT